MDVWEAYRAEWPYLAQGTLWLQHAGITPPCSRVLNAARAAMDGFANDPAGYYRSLWHRATDGARGAVADFLETTPDRVALVKNTSQGIILVAEGYPWRRGDNVVTLAGEYPANRLPWRAAAQLGATVRVVEPDYQGCFGVDRIAAAVDDQTAIVAVSWVQYLNGFQIDLPALAEVCRRHDAFLVVDGVQGVGALPVPLEACDALAVGGHKWLCGTEGAGFLYLAPRLLERLRPLHVSWHSVAVDLSVPGAEIDTEEGLPALKPGAERYEEGTPNAFGNVMLAEAVGMLGEIGVERIARRHRELQEHLLDLIEPLDYHAASSLGEGERSGILAIYHNSLEPEQIVDRLKRERIIAIRRGDAVRLSPHFYNNLDDMERVAAALR
ncbi:MAG: aminotransferase class V-fold PLP-dependent enzyme [Armatimonadetes bacterium]|nr:aminotransferase class V-fold PLP-dependent enzyme [Armatimonadota bacterium]